MRHSVASLSVETLHGLFALESSETASLIRRLQAYKDNFLPEPKKNWDPEEFKKRSYERACIDELTLLARLNPEIPFCDICDSFIDEIEESYWSVNTPVDVFEIVSVMMDMIPIIKNEMRD